MKKSFSLSVLVLMLIVVLSACGSGGSSNGGSSRSSGYVGGEKATYSVGGTVSGLSSMVVLQNNGTDSLVIIANGSFTFATQVADGGAYSVTVLAQPPGQTCTASSNTGTINGANVTDVSVVCASSSSTYSVGGTVSGLAGTVVLQNNGADDLTITSNGGFTFGTAVADGAGYSVTVKTQPSGQTCTASSNTGTINGANVTDVSVVCASSSSIYSVGGTISGLNSSGLVLQNNNGDDLTVPANSTSFIFSTTLANGAAYAVTVKTQPAGQTCTASSNTGTISGANVSNVSVVCSDNFYTVGGSITGLAGAGLVLQNNKTDDLTVPAGSTSFTFAATVAQGAGYAVTVKTQPAGQVCTVTNGSGTATANITNVSIACASADLGPRYSAAPNWNDYVEASDTATACDGTETGGYSACIHGGEMKSIQVPGKTTCFGLTAADSLGAFNWICDGSTNPVQMVSTGLKTGKNLSDLLNFRTVAWKPNSVTVYNGRAPYVTTASTAWWSNPVVADNDGGLLDAAGTIYLVTSSATGAYAFGASKAALVINPGATVTGPGTTAKVIAADGSVNARDFLWIEGRVNAAGDEDGIYLNTVRFAVLRNVTTEGANTGFLPSGVHLQSSSSNRILGIASSNNAYGGVYLVGSSKNLLQGVTVRNNAMGVFLENFCDNNTLNNVSSLSGGPGYMGVYLYSSSSNTLTDIVASNQVGGSGMYLWLASNNSITRATLTNSGGITLHDSHNNRFRDITMANSSGFHLSSSNNNTLVGVHAANSYGYAVNLGDSSLDNKLSDITASSISNDEAIIVHGSSNNALSRITSNNSLRGIRIINSPYTSLNGFAAASHYDIGVALVSSNNLTLNNITATNSDWYGIYISNSSAVRFTGLLKVGNNRVNCRVDGGTDPGLTSICTNTGTSNATLTTGVTQTASFVAKVTTDDIVNASDINGSAPYPADPAAFDWSHFENAYRSWGKDGLFGAALVSQGICATGACSIWDWSLANGDTVIKGVLSLPMGNNILSHSWSNGSQSLYLRNAVEIMGDGIGNENTLCESNETCLYTPNIGSYQGHGRLIFAGKFTNGILTGITLMKYETNGR